MKDAASRVFVLILVLVGVWVVTYWLYEPAGTRGGAGEAKVSFDASQGVDLDDPAMHETVPADGHRHGARHAGAGDAVPPKGGGPVPPPPIHLSQNKGAKGGKDRVPVLVAPEFETYIVQEGDRGWEDIARKVYGDSSQWEAVAKSNPLATSDKLIPGVTKLRYARDPANIQGRVEYQVVPKFPGVVGVDAAKKDDQSKPKPGKGDKLAYVEHVITERDTLWDLAKAYYGKGSLYTRILEANKDVIKDESRLPVGKTIKIPPAENE